MSYHKCSRCAFDKWVMNEYVVDDFWTKWYVIDNIIDAFCYRPYRLMKNGLGDFGSMRYMTIILFLMIQREKVVGISSYMGVIRTLNFIVHLSPTL